MPSAFAFAVTDSDGKAAEKYDSSFFRDCEDFVRSVRKKRKRL